MTAPAAQLDLCAPRAHSPALPEDPDARALVVYLDEAGSWRTRADIERDLGFDERRMLLRGERTGTVFSLGQPVRVKVQNVELTQCNIDLTLLTPLKGRTAGGQTSERKRERDRMRGFNR